MWRKLVISVQLYWIRILLTSIGIGLLLWFIQYMTISNANYEQLESFSRRNISAQMGQSLIMFIFVSLLSAPLTFGMYYWLMSGGAVGKMGTIDLNKVRVNVKMDDVIGMDDAKQEAWEIIKFLKNRDLLKAVGGKNLKGALIIGPPGCGKTYIAKAIATECNIPFLSTVGSDFVGMFMGQGAARMKSLFKQARTLANMEGGCIIFIDEIDSFARPRVADTGFGGSVSNNSTINQFLTELDGLRKLENNIVILAATNVPPEQLDSAITRSGRFDRKIYVNKPTVLERETLIKFYLKKVSHDPAIDTKTLAEKSKNLSPADINNIVREAGVLSIRHNRPAIIMDDLMTALKTILFSVEKMGQDKILSDKVNIHWDDVIGMSETKAEAWEAVKLLKDRNMLKATGGKIIKGIIMFGPPGCGKTYLAKAMATEIGFPFFTVSCTELVGIYVGEGARKIKDIFKEARELAKAEGGCIIFLDELDAFATPRWVAQDHGASTAHNATVNQFLMELDGLRQDENNIFVLGATNVAEKDIDPAVLRAGRLERKLYFHKPNLEDRKELFNYYLKKVKSNADLNINLLAGMTVDFTPAQIESMVREASLLALRESRDTIETKDLTESYDRLTMGTLSNQKYNKKETEMTAYHEAGHAILSYIYHPTDDVIKATIRPRKNALGYVYYRPIDELSYGAPNKEHLLSSIKIGIAGYVAEKIKYGTTSSGVSSDFQMIMQISHKMVWEWGMGRSGLLGNFLAPISREGIPHMSEKTKEVLDADVQDILQTCLKETTDTLTTHRDLLEYFSQELLNKGDLQHDEIQAIFRKFDVKPKTRPEITLS